MLEIFKIGIFFLKIDWKAADLDIYSDKVFATTLDAMCINDAILQMAVRSENIIIFYSLSTWKVIKSQRIELPKSSGRISKMQWANNGQLLLISTTIGHLYGYLTENQNPEEEKPENKNLEETKTEEIDK